jgi:hypothetical protein
VCGCPNFFSMHTMRQSAKADIVCVDIQFVWTVGKFSLCMDIHRPHACLEKKKIICAEILLLCIAFCCCTVVVVFLLIRLIMVWYYDIVANNSVCY